LERGAVAALISKHSPHAVRLDGRTAPVTRLPVQLERAEILGQGLVVASKIGKGLRQIVTGIRDVGRYLCLLPQLEGALEVQKAVVVLALRQIDIADVVQAQRLQ